MAHFERTPHVRIRGESHVHRVWKSPSQAVPAGLPHERCPLEEAEFRLLYVRQGIPFRQHLEDSHAVCSHLQNHQVFQMPKNVFQRSGFQHEEKVDESLLHPHKNETVLVQPMLLRHRPKRQRRHPLEEAA